MPTPMDPVNADRFVNEAVPAPRQVPSQPLVGFKTNSDLDAEKAAQEAAAQPPAPVADEFAGRIRRCFDEARAARNDVEQDMLLDLRQRKGKYDPTTLALIQQHNQPDVYDNPTEVKCYALESWVKDILLFQPGTKPWGLKPTIIPDISPADQQQIVGAAMQWVQNFIAQNQQFPAEQQVFAMARMMRMQMERQRDLVALEKAERMEKQIEDQFEEGGFVDAFDDFLYNFATFPCAILKGPVIQSKEVPVWAPTLQLVDKLVKTIVSVSPLDCYPAPGATDTNDGAFIERKRYSPSKLRDLSKLPGYFLDEVLACVTEYDAGGLRFWTEIDAQRAELEDRKETDYRGYVEALEYWDRVDGKLLKEFYARHNETPPHTYEDGKNYAIQAELIGSHIVRIVMNPSPTGENPYSKVTFRKVAGSFWGRSLPALMRDKQKMVASITRNIAQNIADASRTRAQLDIARLAPGEVVTEDFPGKLWQTDSKGQNFSRNALEYFTPPLIAGELINIREAIVRQLDDDSGVPPYAYGNEKMAGAGRTLGGLQLLMGSASKGIRNAIHQIDINVLKPMVRRFWLHNMLYNPDESIKGDVNIVAAGALAMFEREEIQSRLTNLLGTTANQFDLQIMGIPGRAELLRQTFKAGDVDPEGIVPTRAQLEQQQQAQQQMAQQQQQIPAEAGERKVA